MVVVLAKINDNKIVDAMNDREIRLSIRISFFVGPSIASKGAKIPMTSMSMMKQVMPVNSAYIGVPF
jgi:hypothetical protein